MSVRRVAPLLFGSGFCSLVYQIGWLREFRLVFGASTAASAAVLAIFIGGLGLGGYLLGRRADVSTKPLVLYGNLELIIAASAAVSPLLLAGVRHIYIATGGSFALGLAGGTALRLVLAALVLAVPTLAMGGTLAAVTRAVSAEGDARRRSLAILYGTNTLGAVLGALASTFVLVEIFGTRRTIWIAALINALIAIVARRIGRDAEVVPASPRAPATENRGGAVPLWFVLVTSGVAGFAFFLMEMTWYRMLAPILGGTVFTFGLILAVALFGIGAGGLLFALRSKAATVYGLVLTCVIEAIGLAIPLVLGDRIALAAGTVRSTAVFGFGGQVLGWALIAGLVILPAAIASGVQFPLLVNLVGRGRAGVGRELGLVYATNTIGAIAGSLVGGFVLLPGIGAIGCWRVAIGMLLAIAIVALVLARPSWQRLAAFGAPIALAILLAFAGGPTAAWRHGGIGAGRGGALTNPAAAAEFIAKSNRTLVWEAEGVESSVALSKENGLAFVVNGKIDGNASLDVATQIMGGLVGAIIHPAPKRALVIGLGTGETAGWLADAPGIEHVDVIELEPAILEVARRCAALNRDVLHNRKVDIHIGDAREALLVGDGSYDVIFSEPSNPYRAGVSSLYTKEFYEAVRERLGKDGVFLQWTQSYEIDGETIATIYATLGSVFPEVHTFRLHSADLLFVASPSRIQYDTARIASRVAASPVKEALAFAWGVDGVEGFLSHFIGDNRLAAAIAERAGGTLNTDDHTPIEFAFARTLGFQDLHNGLAIRRFAVSLEVDQPPVVGALDGARFDELRAFSDAVAKGPLIMSSRLTPQHVARARARHAYESGNLAAAASAWKQQPAAPATPYDARLVAESLGSIGEAADLALLRPAEAAFVRARLAAFELQWGEAATQLVAAFTATRSDPFLEYAFIARAIQLATAVAEKDPTRARALAAALAEPFALYQNDEARVLARIRLARLTNDASTIVDALRPVEPYVPWVHAILVLRRDVYATTNHDLLERAERDLAEFYDGRPMPLTTSEPGNAAE